jgi:hypothetical protein
MVKQDLTGASGASVTLSHPVANANEVELYINNVRQEPTTSYTTNGTTLSFVNYTVAASDDIYVIFSGKALQTVVPPDGSVSTAKIASSAVDLTSKVTGILPVANGGTGLSSGFVNGITEFDTWRITLNTANTASSYISSNWERSDDTEFEKIGTGMSESSGVFTFPSTGKYIINAFVNMQARNGTVSQGRAFIYTTIDNSNYYDHSQAEFSGSSDHCQTINCQMLFNVTDVSNRKIRIGIYANTNNVRALGASDKNRTYVTFMKIGA